MEENITRNNLGILLQQNEDNNIKFRVFLLNIRSIGANIDELLAFLVRGQVSYDAIVLTETWQRDDLQHQWQIEGFNAFFSPESRSKAGGVAVYVSSLYESSLIETKPLDCDVCNVEVKFDDTTIQIIGVYRSPNPKYSNINNFITELPHLCKLGNARNKVILTDSNIDVMKSTPNSTSYLDTLAEEGFAIKKTGPTRLSERSVSAIDQVLINLKTLSDPSVNVENTHGISDHQALIVTFEKTRKVHEKIISNSCYKKINNRKFVHELRKIGWQVLLTEDEDPDRLYNKILAEVKKCESRATEGINKVFSNRRKILKPWITPDILRKLRARDEIFQMLQTHPDLKESHKRMRNLIKLELKKAKDSYFAQRFTNDKKQDWATINEYIRGKRSSEKLDPSSLNICSGLPSTQEKVNFINQHFSEMGANVSKSNNPSVTLSNIPVYSVRDQLRAFIVPSIEQITNDINKLSRDKAPGEDYITNNMVKDNIDLFAPILRRLASTIFSSGRFPEGLKSSNLVLIHKKGRKDDIENFRPISLLSTIGKLIEKIIVRELKQHLDKNSILNKKQYGFQEGKSTETALMALQDIIGPEVDKGNHPVGIFVDLSRAFNTIPHSRLKEKLKQMGVTSLALNVIETYLHKRKQCYSFDNQTSEAENPPYGVPQGSVLGPLLYLIYCNDIFHLQDGSEKLMFADDTALIYKRSPTQTFEHIEKGLRHIGEWTKENGLVINHVKTQFIIFSLRPKDNITIDRLQLHSHKEARPNCTTCKYITRTDNTKYLGMTIAENLSWTPHINTITKKIRKGLAVLAQIKNSATQTFKTQVYRALIESHLRYGLTCFGGTFPSLLMPLAVLQNKAVRIVSNSHHMANANSIMAKLGIQPLRHLYAERVLNFYLIREPEIGNNIRNRNRPSHNYETRSRHNNILNLTYARRETTRKTAAYHLIKLLNSCTEDIRNDNIRNRLQLKRTIRQHVDRMSAQTIALILS